MMLVLEMLMVEKMHSLGMLMAEKLESPMAEKHGLYFHGCADHWVQQYDQKQTLIAVDFNWDPPAHLLTVVFQQFPLLL